MVAPRLGADIEHLCRELSPIKLNDKGSGRVWAPHRGHLAQYEESPPDTSASVVGCLGGPEVEHLACPAIDITLELRRHFPRLYTRSNGGGLSRELVLGQ